jgi:WD40 repeat protein
MADSSPNINIGQDAKGVIGYNVIGNTIIQEQKLLITPEAIELNPFQARSPYKALKRFDVDDREYFFGRYQLTFELKKAIEVSNLILVLGASGSGKSSVVRAKLIPEFLSASSHRHDFILTPNDDPFQSLYKSLMGENKIGSDKDYYFSEAKAQRVLEGKPNGKPDVLTRMIRQLKDEESEWLIFIDQFEELFTRCTNLEQRKNFIKSITQIAESDDRSVKIVLAMRADFLEQFSPYPQFGQVVQRQIHLVTDMPEDELELAIKGPAAKHGVRFEPGLAKEIIQDVQGQAGALPLMQYTLDQLWKYEIKVDGLTDHILNTKNYRDLGKVRGSLEKHVSEIYEDLGVAGQQAAKRIFLNLVKLVTTDGVMKPVSQNISRSALQGGAVQETIDRLINENLLVSSSKDLSQAVLQTEAGKNRSQQATIEIAHEILLSSWKILEGWIREAKEILLIKSRLAEDMGRWNNQKQVNEELLKGSILEKVLELKKENLFELQSVPLSSEEEKYIDASQRYQKRELNRARRVAVGALIGAVLMAGSAIIALFQVQQAQRQRVEQLAANAEVSLSGGRTVNAVINAIAAVGLSQSALVKFPGNSQFSSGNNSLLNVLQEKNWEKNQFFHEAAVRSVSYSPDGKHIVSGSYDYTVQIWDVKTGAPIGKALQGHEAKVNSVGYSPDGKRIVSGSLDRTVRIWDAKTGIPIGKPLKGHEYEVSSVSYSLDGKRIFSLDSDGKIFVWDASTGVPIGKPLYLKGDSDWVIGSVSYSPDGKYIAGRTMGLNTLQIWDTRTGVPIGKPLGDKSIQIWDQSNELHFEKPTRAYDDVGNSISYSPDGKKIVSIGPNGKTMQIWNVSTGDPVGQPLQGHDDLVTSVSYSPDGKHIISGSLDKTVRLWNANTGAPMGQPLRGHEDWITSVSYSPDGKHIVSGSYDKTVRVWDATTETLAAQSLKLGTDVLSVSYSPDGKHLVTGSSDKTVRIWNAITGVPIGKPLQGHEDSVTSVAFSPDGGRIVSGSSDKTIRIWNAITGVLIGKPLQGHEDSVTSVAFSPDGGRIASGSSDKTIRIWNAITGVLIGKPLRGHENLISSVAFSPDGKHIVSGSYDQSVWVWDASTGVLIGRPLPVHEEAVTSVSYSPDGKRIVSGSVDNTLRIWDAGTVTPIGKPLRGHQADVLSVSYSPDGKRIVSGSVDNTLRIWDAGTGVPIGKPLQSNFFGGNVASYSPDGKRIVSTAGQGETVEIWDVYWESLLPIACNQLRYHPSLNQPTTDVAREAKQTCEQYVWKH